MRALLFIALTAAAACTVDVGDGGSPQGDAIDSYIRGLP